MNQFKAKYDEYTSEFLLELRARGDDLSDDAHAAIEAVFRERGEALPDRPAAPIQVRDGAVRDGRTGKTSVATALMVFVVGAVVAQVVVKSWLVYPVAAALAGGYLWRVARRQAMTPEQLADEKFDATAQERALTELMTCAAAGDVRRVKDLLAFGAPVDDRDLAGATALMYAARNGNESVVQMLLDASADRSIKNSKGATAKDLALRFGHKELAAQL